MISYWKCKIAQIKEGLKSVTDLLRPSLRSIPLLLQRIDFHKKAPENQVNQQQLVLSSKPKKNDRSELLTQLLIENISAIKLLKPIVTRLKTLTSLHTIYNALVENLAIILHICKIENFSTTSMFHYTNVLMVNMLNCMNLKDSLRIITSNQAVLNFYCTQIEKYVNHLQVLLLLLTSGKMTPCGSNVTKPCLLTVRTADVNINERRTNISDNSENPETSSMNQDLYEDV